MKNNEFADLILIAISSIAGFIIGTIACLIVTARENKALQEEVDKFRDLYFEEIDKWRNKYVDDDYEAY